MSNVTALVNEGKLTEAIDLASASLRKDPTDLRLRTSLFELLCFAGEWERAQRQLQMLSSGSADQHTGAMFYHHVLAATRLREDSFPLEQENVNSVSEWPDLSGTLDGEPFTSFFDTDTRVGPALEVIAGADYLRIPLLQLKSVSIEEPKRLRDLLWVPATVTVTDAFAGAPLRDVLLPVLAPASCKSSDDAVRLGRSTVWQTGENGVTAPLGQRMFLADDREIPLLQIRSILFESATECAEKQR